MTDVAQGRQPSPASPSHRGSPTSQRRTSRIRQPSLGPNRLDGQPLDARPDSRADARSQNRSDGRPEDALRDDRGRSGGRPEGRPEGRPGAAQKLRCRPAWTAGLKTGPTDDRLGKVHRR